MVMHAAGAYPGEYLRALSFFREESHHGRGCTEHHCVLFRDVREKPVAWLGDTVRRADDFKALVDRSTGKVFSVVSQDYRLIRREEAIERIEASIAHRKDLRTYNVVTEFGNDCGRMRRIYSFPQVTVEISPDDEVCLELHLCNSYDRSWPFLVLLGGFRFVCENGLVVGKKFLHLRKRHIYELGGMNLEEEIPLALDRFDRQTKEWKRWAAHNVTPKLYKQVMTMMEFGKSAQEEIAQRIEQEAEGADKEGVPIISLWLFYNIITWYITHRAISLNHRVTMERRLRSALRSVKVR